MSGLLAAALTCSILAPASARTEPDFTIEERELNRLIGQPLITTETTDNISTEVSIFSSLTIQECIFSVRQNLRMRIVIDASEMGELIGTSNASFAAKDIRQVVWPAVTTLQDHSEVQLQFDRPISFVSFTTTTTPMTGEENQSDETLSTELNFGFREKQDAERVLNLFRSVISQCRAN